MPSIDIEKVETVIHNILETPSKPTSQQLAKIAKYTYDDTGCPQVERMLKRRLSYPTSYNFIQIINVLLLLDGILSNHDSSNRFKSFCVSQCDNINKGLAQQSSNEQFRLKHTLTQQQRKNIQATSSKLVNDLKVLEQKQLIQIDPKFSPISLSKPLLPSPIHTPATNSIGLPKPGADTIVKIAQEKGNEDDALVANITEYVEIDKNALPRAGGFSYVQKGTYKHGARCEIKVAIKYLQVPRDSQVTLERLITRFRRETKAWCTLKHKNIAPFYGYIKFPDSPVGIAMVSPWYPDGNLMEYLKKHDKADRLEMMIGICRGLKYLHERDPQVTHGDIKATNVVVDIDQTPKLIDFGIAKELRNSEYKPTGDTTQSVPYSAAWASPEVLMASENSSPWTPKSDVYSFASTCLEIITGQGPYGPKLNVAQIYLRLGHEKKHPDRPSSKTLKYPLSDDLWKLLVKCWAYDPSHRPSIDEVYTKLKAFRK